MDPPQQAGSESSEEEFKVEKILNKRGTRDKVSRLDVD